MEWEYEILSDLRVGNKYDAEEPAKSRLNDLGAQGWELVAAFPTSYLGTTVTVVYVFKRAKGSA
jgi:hypothetical protein